jgi:hypothetical protein
VTTLGATLRRLPARRIDRAWLVIAAILALLALVDGTQLVPSLRFTGDALLHTAPYVAFAVLAIAYLKASAADAVIARAFQGREARMIVLASLFGGLAPFCSCEVIPFVAGLLAVGTPLSAVMAFWLSSPLIDPASLLITAGALGWPFAIAKTVAAVGIGLFGGFAIKLATGAGLFANPARPRESSCCGPSCGASPSSGTLSGTPRWRVWENPADRAAFAREAKVNALFLLKWLTLAYLLESLMLAYVPAEAIAHVAGGDGLGPIVLAALVGAPAYLNSFAAPPLVAGLVAQGMSAGAAMSFMIAGAVSCIPAMTAVYALVRPPVFAAYAGLGIAGAVVAGIAWGAWVDVFPG